MIKYYKDKEGITHSFEVEVDDDPLDPRYDFDGQIGKMMCWHRNYQLGDYKDNEYSDPEDFLNSLIRKKVTEKQIINYIKNKKTSNGLELKYNRKDGLWELWGYYYLFPLQGEKDARFSVIESNNPIEYLVDDMIEALSFEDKWKLLERYANIVFLPLYLYDHSGITMNTTGFSCRWDSGQVGYIYTDKETVLACGGKIKSDKGNYINVTTKNWKKAAYQWMDMEVEEYDMYLQNEVYGYTDTNLETDETDSCWGFFSKEWGDDLFNEMVLEAGIEVEEWLSNEEIA